MGKTIFSVFMLALILTSGTLANAYINKTFDALDFKLDEIKVCLDEKDLQGAKQKTADLNGWWDTKKHGLEFITYSQDLRLISSSIGETLGSLKNGDDNNAMSKVVSLLVISKTTRDMLTITIENIF